MSVSCLLGYHPEKVVDLPDHALPPGRDHRKGSSRHRGVAMKQFAATGMGWPNRRLVRPDCERRRRGGAFSWHQSATTV